MSNSRTKVLVVHDHGPTHYKPFEFLGLTYCTDNTVLEEAPETVALVVLTGGADVCPGLYGRGQHKNTACNIERDIRETGIVNTAASHGIPLAGICRGAQFLCVLAGGRLVQDITGHHYCKHPLTARYPDGELREVLVNGDHHQMQYPFDLAPNDYEVLAWGVSPRSKHYAFDAEIVVPQKDAGETLRMEPDVVWYPELKALAAQFHPEWMHNDSEGVKYYQALVEHYLVPLMETNDTNGPREKAA